jgi:glycosyltransferase involved in cell wall biosynthesis
LALRILFLTWRDQSNPAAGGAETFTEEVGKRLSSFGNDVTIFASTFNGCQRITFRSKMKIIREGGKYRVYAKARGYVKKNEADFDIIIDQINTVPFGIPKVVKNTPVVALIHQLAREIWFYETRFPLNALGFFILEPLWLRGYRRIPTVTVSDSTKMDLLNRGFLQVHTIHNGITAQALTELPEKAPNPVFAFVGRLVRSKHPDHAISAFEKIRETLPTSELWIIGDGYLRRKLDRDPKEGVTFFGRVRDDEKFQLLKRAHILLVPSTREGWGVSVIEANAMGTPAVGYDVHGLRDSIVHNVTGLRVQSNPSALAEASINVLNDSTILKRLSANALDWSKKFNWDYTATEFQSFLKSKVEGPAR